MNKKMFSGIVYGTLFFLGVLVHTTTLEARSKSAAPDKNLENLTKCAAEKNPEFLAHVLTGAFIAYDKDATAGIKASDMQRLTKAKESLSHVILFLLQSSGHLSPIYKSVEHQPKFDKAINQEIQKLYKKEYAAARDPKIQGAITKDFRTFVKDLESSGVKELSKIVSPQKADKKAKKKAKKIKSSANDKKQKGKKTSKRSAPVVVAAPEEEDVTESPSEEESPAADDESAVADDASTADEEEAVDDASTADEEEAADDESAGDDEEAASDDEADSEDEETSEDE